MNTQHTPEPWSVHNGHDIFTDLGAVNGAGDRSPYNDGWHIADCDVAIPFDGCMLTPQEIAANACRIVACVNACAGLTSDDLDAIAKTGGLAEITVGNWIKLRAALDEIASMGVPGASYVALQAIAKARGQQS